MTKKIFAISIVLVMISNIFCNILYVTMADEVKNNVEANLTENVCTNSKIENESTSDDTNDNEISNETEKNEIIENNISKNENQTENNTTSNEITNNTETENGIDNNSTVSESVTNENKDAVMLLSEDENKLGVTYRTHVENIGWQDYVKNEEIAGTSGKSYRLEGINIKLIGNNDSNLKIKYQVHVQNIGWQDWKTDGEMAGTQGLCYRLEGIKIKLESTEEYSVMYRVHVQNIGWQDWKTDGEMAGTQGQSLRLEAIQIKIVPKVKKGIISIENLSNGQTYYNPSSINVVGWKMANVSNTKIKAYIDNTQIDEKALTYKKRDDVITSMAEKGYGTDKENPNPGFEFSIDSSNMTEGEHNIKFVLATATDEVLEQKNAKIYIDRQLHVQYRAHVENIGWQNYVKDSEMAGTSGKCYRVEALNINLINAPDDAKILYRAHVQNIGWQNWQQNGSMAGTSGKSYRIEAIEIMLENLDKYTVEYQVHIQDKGWSDWYMDGETAGTVGQGKRIEALRIRLVPKKEKRQYKGIDVSVYNRSVNWGLVKRDGIDFAFIRAGFRGYGSKGTLNEDPYYKLNMQGARQAEVPVGVYFVTQAINEDEAREEAYWVLERVKNYKIDYPIAIDIEAPGLENPNDIPRTQNLDKNTRTRIARAFCETIQNAGYKPIVYCNVDWAYNYLNMSELSAYDTWIASYRDNNPGYNGKYSIWQYTSKGQVSGVLGNVDRNICYKKY
mgnify:CR=1 FL=1